MIIVADCSIIVAFAIESETMTDYARAVEPLIIESAFHAPSHFDFEAANALLTAHRGKRIDEDGLRAASRYINGFNPRIDFSTNKLTHSVTMIFAKKHDLTIYDAAYLELAIRIGGRLATADRKLRKAALAEGVFLEPA